MRKIYLFLLLCTSCLWSERTWAQTPMAVTSNCVNLGEKFYSAVVNRTDSFYFGYSAKTLRAHDGKQIVMTQIINGTTTSIGLSKLDSLGRVMWFYNYTPSGSVNGMELPTCITMASDSGFIIGGEAKGYTTRWDPFLFKVDRNGNPLWYKTYTCSRDMHINAIAQSSNGNIALCGADNYPVACWSTGGTCPFNAAITMVTDATGNLISFKPYDLTYNSAGRNWEQFFDVIALSNGDFLFSGSSGHNWDYNAALMVRTDASGTMLWIRNYRIPTSSGTYDLWNAGANASTIVGQCMVQDSPSTVVFGGYYSDHNRNGTGATFYDLIYMKFDLLSGSVTWSKRYSDGQIYALPFKIIKDNGGQLTAVGYRNNATSGMFMKLDPATGNIQANTSYFSQTGGMGTRLLSIADDGTSNYFVAGLTNIKGPNRVIAAKVATTGTNTCMGNAYTYTATMVATDQPVMTVNTGSITSTAVSRTLNKACYCENRYDVCTPATDTLFTMSKDTICPNDSVIFKTKIKAYKTCSNNAYTYTWEHYDGGTVSGTTITGGTLTHITLGDSLVDYEPITAGITKGYVKLSVKNCSGTVLCTKIATITVGATSANLAASQNPICSGQSTTLTATGGTASTYTWSTGATTNSIVVSPTTTTSYTLTNGASGCTSTSVITVSVTTTPTVSISGNSYVCTAHSTPLTASGATTYTWSTGGTSPVLVAAPASSQTYSVTGANGTCTNTASFSLTVAPTPTMTISGPMFTCAGQTTTLSASGTTITYTWSTGSNSSSITPAPTTITTYTLTGTDALGCTNQQQYTLIIAALPTIAVSGPTLVCSGQTVTVTAGSPTATSYTWSTGSSGNSTTVTPFVNSTYTVTAANPNGCTNTATHTFSVVPMPTVSISGNPNVCIGQSATLNASGANSYTWAPVPVTGSVYIATPTGPTTCIVTGSNGVCTDTASMVMNVLPNPVLTVTGTNTVCAGLATTINVSGASTYTWSTGANASTIPVSPSGTTVYTVSGTDAQGCFSSQTTTVTAIPLPVLTIVGPTTSCLGQSVTLTATGALTYSWSTGAVLTNSITVSPTSSTTYTVMGIDINGCIGTTATAMNVSTIPTVTVSGTPNVCPGDPVLLSANGAAIYLWSTGESSASISVAPMISTTYTVMGGTSPCTTTATYAINVYAPTPVVATAVPSLVVYGSPSLLSAASTGISYEWFPKEGVACSNCPSTVATPSATTIYTIVTTDNNGCRSADTIRVWVDIICGDFFIPSAFSPDNDGHNDTWCIYGNCIEQVTVQVFDRWGQLVFESLDKAVCWDGTYNGQEANGNVFSYQVYAYLVTKEKLYKKGTITLVK